MKKKSNRNISISKKILPTIGLLTEGLSGQYQAGVWPGIVDAVRERGLNLICFCGGSLQVSPSDPWDYQGNIVYKIAQKHDLDGLIIAGSLGSYVPEQVLKEFLGRFRHIPVVTLAPTCEPVPAVFVDNRSGMRSLISHLVEKHRYKKLAFIRGPERNVEAQERFRIFGSVLKEHGIAVDTRLVFQGDFTRRCGVEAVERLIASGRECDVIVAAADETALGALQALESHGRKVPDDIALVGFDDIEESSYVTPPLTTVNQPLYALGKTAVQLLLRLLGGETIPRNTILEAQLIVRQSCGCFRQFGDGGKISRAVSHQKKLSVSDVLDACGDADDGLFAEYAPEIIALFCNDVNGRRGDSFLKIIDRVAHACVDRSKRLSAWSALFFRLWQYVFTRCDARVFARADDLLHKARVICGEAGLRKQGIERIRTVRKNRFLYMIGDALKNSLAIDKLMDVMCEYLPRLDIDTFYLSLYEPAARMPGKKSRLKLAYINRKREKLRTEGVVFDTDHILPDGILPAHTAHILVVEPLYFQMEHFGTVLFEHSIGEYQYYKELKEHISGALYSAALIKKVRHQTDVLAQANRELKALREKEHEYLQAIKGELALGRKIQTGFLPRTLPQPPGWEISAAFMPAREVSGDFYDAFLLDEDQVALVIADVSGKDVSAALFMSLIRTLIRVFSERAYKSGENPFNAVKVVNDYIIQHHVQQDGHCMFATIFFGLLRPASGELCYVNAGHNAPMIIRRNRVVRELKSTSIAVGLADNFTFSQQQVVIEPGEMLFSYTDGITEAKGPEGDFFTTRRLVGLLESERTTAGETVEQVKNALNDYYKGTAPSDDITMLAVKRALSPV